MAHFDTPTARLRTVALAEGVSYLLLLFVAMPLKYVWGMPLAVRILGSVHGALFVWLMAQLADGMRSRGRPLGWAVRIGVASLLPFGTIVLDRRLRGEDEEYRRASTER